jgi:hypothetical protein
MRGPKAWSMISPFAAKSCVNRAQSYQFLHYTFLLDYLLVAVGGLL